MQYGISELKAGGSGPYDLKWHGGTGLFSIVAGSSGFQSSQVTLQHDVSASGQAAQYVSLGADAEFTADGQIVFTTASNSLRVVFGSGAGSEDYHIVVKPVNERSAY